jgi:GTP-binding protein
MRFVDEAVIEVASGDGGRGCVSFMRTKYEPRGGPDGGNGGRGGHVTIQASAQVATLADHSYLRHFRGGRGWHGQGSNKTGASGEDKLVTVPVGTAIYDDETGELLADLTEEGQEFIAAEGGRGGKGNRHFVSSTHRSPRFAQPGEPGEKKTLRLELKVLADVGLIGLPNAGKSSLIRAATAARPKVADYPFTTLSPHLGVAEVEPGLPIVIADIPGLVAGAHQGAGLGLKFLKHVERTRLFVHVVDMSAEDPLSDLGVILAEIEAYDPGLMAKAGLVAANKLDLPGTLDKMDDFRQNVESMGLTVFGVSAKSGQGVDELMRAISARLGQAEDENEVEQEPTN